MAINIGYFGLSLNTSNLSGNPFMNCFLSAISEVPAYVVSTCLLRKCSRRILLSTFLVIGGGVLLLIQFIPNSNSSLHFLSVSLFCIKIYFPEHTFNLVFVSYFHRFRKQMFCFFTSTARINLATVFVPKRFSMLLWRWR